MRKFKIFSMFIGLALLLSLNLVSAMAQEPDIDNGSDVSLPELTCSGKVSKQQIETLAKMIVNNNITKEIRTCYEQLTDEGKADVFEEMARERDISVEELYKESREDLANTKNSSQTRGQNWDQLVEHANFGSNLVSVSDSWFSYTTCDSHPDVDYIFKFNFSSAVSNPDALRNISTTSLAVDAMLVWYQVRYGGVKGFGNTGSSRVYICIGDTGVAIAGGVGAVEDHMKLFR